MKLSRPRDDLQTEGLDNLCAEQAFNASATPFFVNRVEVVPAYLTEGVTLVLGNLSVVWEGDPAGQNYRAVFNFPQSYYISPTVAQKLIEKLRKAIPNLDPDEAET